MVWLALNGWFRLLRGVRGDIRPANLHVHLLQQEQGATMRRRNRKLVGAFLMLAFVSIYALAAMALAQARPLQEASKLIQAISYALLGLGWTIPMLPLIKWMERGGE